MTVTFDPPVAHADAALAASWRKTLCNEWLNIPALADRDANTKRQLRDLSLSLAVLDHGLHRLAGTGLTLADLRLGALMRASGYDLNDDLLPAYGSLI